MAKAATPRSKTATLGKSIAKAVAPVIAKNLPPGRAAHVELTAIKVPKGAGRKR